MREIKFRAWDERCKDMVYFGLGQDGFKTYDLFSGENYTLELCSKPPVMQYTGLKDRDGNEIYEGDIVKCPHGDVSPVTYDDSDCGGGRFNFLNYLSAYCETCADKQRWMNFEVIGNIYENPELLDEHT